MQNLVVIFCECWFFLGFIGSILLWPCMKKILINSENIPGEILNQLQVYYPAYILNILLLSILGPFTFYWGITNEES